jgi:serine/threonine protein kinase
MARDTEAAISYLFGALPGYRRLGSLTSDHLVQLMERERDGVRVVAMRTSGDSTLTPAFQAQVASTWAALDHPGVVRLVQVFADTVVIREHVAGQDLRSLLYGKRDTKLVPLPADLLAYLGVRICDALSALHRTLGAHGALAPRHVLASIDGEVKLIGVEERHQEVVIATTRADVYVPSYLAWLAPEAGRTDTRDPRGDLFSLGVCLWEWAAGKRLFARDTSIRTFEAVVRAPIPPVTAHRPDLPAPLVAAISGALQRDRSARVQSASELRQLLREALCCDEDLARHALAALVADGGPCARRFR